MKIIKENQSLLFVIGLLLFVTSICVGAFLAETALISALFIFVPIGLMGLFVIIALIKEAIKEDRIYKEDHTNWT